MRKHKLASKLDDGVYKTWIQATHLEERSTHLFAPVITNSTAEHFSLAERTGVSRLDRP